MVKKSRPFKKNVLSVLIGLLVFCFDSYAVAEIVDKECPVTDPSLAETDFPGYDPKNIKSFSRDQDSIGNCYAFMWADFLAFHAKKSKAWPSGGIYSAGASAMDMMLQFAIIADRPYPTADSFIKAVGFDIEEFSQRTADHMSKVGLCAEKQFPSEFLPKETGAFDTYIGFAKSYGKVKSTEAGVADLYWCPECLAIAPTLKSNSNLKKNAEEILKLVSEMKQKGDSYQALILLNEKSCPSNQRVKFPKIKMAGSASLKDVDGQLLKNNPVMVSLSPEAVMTKERMQAAKKRSKNGRVAGHAALLVGATRFPELQNACYYIIKNSWGDHCQADLPHQVCLESGAMAIRSDLFKAKMIEGRWAE